jgi:hypothetical protein
MRCGRFISWANFSLLLDRLTVSSSVDQFPLQPLAALSLSLISCPPTSTSSTRRPPPPHRLSLLPSLSLRHLPPSLSPPLLRFALAPQPLNQPQLGEHHSHQLAVSPPQLHHLVACRIVFTMLSLLEILMRLPPSSPLLPPARKLPMACLMAKITMAGSSTSLFL